MKAYDSFGPIQRALRMFKLERASTSPSSLLR